MTTRIAAVVRIFFGTQQFLVTTGACWLGFLNLASAVAFLLIPRLYRYGDVLLPVVFYALAYALITTSTVYFGSGIGLHFYFVIAAAIAILVLSVVIADGYDDASILFADIAGYTKQASDTPPGDLVRFLDALYTDLDALVDRHGLEKVKTRCDSYMVVSGVPEPRADHLEALAGLALDMADAVAGLVDSKGRDVPLRMGLASGPVVAGVVGVRKFFYDVWGDAVNVASRMESTDVEGRIQDPDDVYERLRDRFAFEERGEIDVKGKGLARTWYLVGRRA